jgi:hypothetical protein
MGSFGWIVMSARSQPTRVCSTTRPSQDAGPRSACAALRMAWATAAYAVVQACSTRGVHPSPAKVPIALSRAAPTAS